MRRAHPEQLGMVFTRRTARSAGLTRHEVEWALKSGRWLVLRRGVYCLRDDYEAADRVQRYLLHSRAALVAHDERHVLSHLSAAMSYGWPAPLGDLGRPSLTIGGTPASTDVQDDLVVQVAGLRGGEVAQWEGWRRTAPARTVADCLRHLPDVVSVPLADEAVRTGRTSYDAIESTLGRQESWPYRARGVEALRLVDGRRESWLESYSFVSLYAEGIALPTAQVEIYDEVGAFVGRVDGLWEEHATVAEADGRAKYDLARSVELADVEPLDLPEARFEAQRRALVREKVREDRLRSIGLEMVRWGTRDVVHGRTALVRTILAAWRRGSPLRFTGTVVVPAAAPPATWLAVESGV